MAMALVVLGLVAVLVGDFAGLWFVLLGLFLGTAAKAEQDTQRLAQVDVTAGEVATRDPVCAPGWYTIAAFLDWAGAHGARRAYPVLDFESRPAGVIVLDDLARDAKQTAAVRVIDAARPMDRVPVLAPDQPAAALLTTAGRRRGITLALVVEDGRLVGTIDLADVAAAIQLASLRRNFAHH